MSVELLEDSETEVPPILQRYAAEEIEKLENSLVYQGTGVPHGDGQHVFLYPGYLESDREFCYLTKYLKRIGYIPESSGIGTNIGHPWQQELMRQRVRTLIKNFGKAYIIGHSLGGFGGAQIAQTEPGVEKTIAIGAPFLGGIDSENSSFRESIYSPKDGVVKSFMSKFSGPHSRNVEVFSPNHFELLCHEETFREIGLALAS